MLLADVNVLVYAFRPDSADHKRYRDWLVEAVYGESAFGCSELVLSGFIRIVTHPRVFTNPDPLPDALHFATAIREAPNVVRVSADKQGGQHRSHDLGNNLAPAVGGGAKAMTGEAIIGVDADPKPLDSPHVHGDATRKVNGFNSGYLHSGEFPRYLVPWY